MIRSHLDFESYSAADLKKVGLYRYAEHFSTSVWLFSYRLGNGPVRRWHPGDPDPRELLQHVADGGTVVAHNSAFERQIWNTVLCGRIVSHWPRLSIEQLDCTMSRALAIHLPADLDRLGAVLQLKQQKDAEGAALMKKMMKPRKRLPDGTYIWWDQPENIRRLGDYCDQDVATECEADRVLPALSAAERALWERDQRINDRGFALDLDMVQRCIDVRAIAQQRADALMEVLTEGEVKRGTEAAKIVEWLARRGIPCTSIAKEEHAELKAIAEILDDQTAIEVIDLRRESAKNSTAKFDAMLASVCDDGRARGMLGYHRASTGRWGGSLIQPHNLPQVDEEKDLPKVLQMLDILEIFNDARYAHDVIEKTVGPVMLWLSKCLRAMVIA